MLSKKVSYSFLVLLFFLILSGLGTYKVSAGERVNLKEATELILDTNHYSQYKNAQGEIPIYLEELTTVELWERMRIQIFLLEIPVFKQETIYGTYIIQHKKAIKLGKELEDLWIIDFCTTDLNHDQKPELIYSCYGSIIGVYMDQEEDLTLKVFGFLTLKKLDDQTVEIRNPGLIGWPQLKKVKGHFQLSLKVNPQILPYNLRYWKLKTETVED